MLISIRRRLLLPLAALALAASLGGCVVYPGPGYAYGYGPGYYGPCCAVVGVGGGWWGWHGGGRYYR
jgi:hypothetical protein